MALDKNLTYARLTREQFEFLASHPDLYKLMLRQKKELPSLFQDINKYILPTSPEEGLPKASWDEFATAFKEAVETKK